MSFFDKFAKLKSDVSNDGYEFTVNVYDDEVSMEKPVMWLSGYVNKLEDYVDDMEDEDLLGELMNKYEFVVYVDIVDTDDSIYFELPESRKNTCATSLFKRFIKFYKETYSGELVSANFENYDLQEKFKVAAEKGIFPKESLELIGETSKENYDKSETFNMNNREQAYTENKLILDHLINDGLDVTSESSIYFIKNQPVSKVYNSATSLIERIKEETEKQLSILDEIPIKLNGIDYEIMLPIDEFIDYDDLDLIFTMSSKTVKIIEYSNQLINTILQDESKFREVFDEATHIYDESFDTKTIDEFFAQNNTTASNKIVRLIKKSTK